MNNRVLNIGESWSDRLKRQQLARQDGVAFASHRKACHDGDTDPNCRACKELAARIEEK